MVGGILSAPMQMADAKILGRIPRGRDLADHVPGFGRIPRGRDLVGRVPGLGRIPRVEDLVDRVLSLDRISRVEDLVDRVPGLGRSPEREEGMKGAESDSTNLSARRVA
jgi:hypothetical protein